MVSRRRVSCGLSCSVRLYSQSCSVMSRAINLNAIELTLAGSSFIFRHQELMDAHSQHLSKRTTQVLHRARDRDARAAARGGAYSPSPNSSLSASPQMSQSPLHTSAPHVNFDLPGSATYGHSAPYISPGAASISSNYSDMSATSQGLFGSMNGSMVSANGGAEQGSNVAWNALRRHVVKHDRNSIRDALLIGRTEHMSTVDTCVSIHLSLREALRA